MASPSFGMFGPDPYSAMVMDDANALNEIKAIQEGGPGVAMGLLANRGFRGLRNALGMEDPAQERGNKMKKIVEELRQAGIDMTNPDEFYPAMVKSLSAAGLNNEAQAMMDKYRTDALEGSVKTAQATKYRAEAAKAAKESQPELIRLQNQLRLERESPNPDQERIKQIMDKISALVQPRTDKVTAGVEGSPELQQEILIGPDGKPVYTGTPFKKSPLVDNSTKMDNAFTLEAAKEWGARAKEFQTGRASMAAAEPVLDGLKDIVGRGQYTQGSMADIRTVLERGLETVGIKSDPQKLSDSELFDSYVMQFVLPRMKMLGGSDSNEELRAIRESVPNRKWTPESVRKFIQQMEFETALVEGKQKQYEAWLNSPKRETTSFDFRITKEEREALKQAMGLKKKQEQQSAPARTEDQIPGNGAPVAIPRRAVEAYKKWIKDTKNKDISDAEAEAALSKYKR